MSFVHLLVMRKNKILEQELSDLISISRFYGKNEDYILAGGGNTSYKNSQNLWVKASGVSLKDITESDFVCMAREGLQIISAKKYSQRIVQREAEVKKDMQQAVVSSGGKRPSVETLLHEIIDYPFVVHTHPTLVNALMCSNKAKQVSAELFGKDMLFIEYTDPGYTLFKKVAYEIAHFRTERKFMPKIIFLENHGIFVGGNTMDEIKETYSDIEKKIRSRIIHDIPSDKPELCDSEVEKEIHDIILSDKGLASGCITSELIRYFVKNRESFRKVEKPFTPDNIVYCKAHYLFLDYHDDENQHIEKIPEEINAFIKKYGYAPKIIGVKGKGIIAVDENERSVTTVQKIFIDMMKISFYTEDFGGPKFMTAKQMDFIDHWEVENYRRKIAKNG